VIEVRIFDGALETGDTITITLGARGEGSLGLVMQSFPERDFRLIGLVDAFAPMVVFIGILALGLAWAWRNGAVQWARSQQAERQRVE